MSDAQDNESHGFLVYEEIHEPLNADEELFNAMTHGVAAASGVLAAGYVVFFEHMPIVKLLCCLVFILSGVAVFVASTLSHCFLSNAATLNKLRAWDQGLIYLMISGTYTPIVWQFSDAQIKVPFLMVLWISAIAGFYSKVFVEHRVNSIGVKSYLLLGVLPSILLSRHVPAGMLYWMVAGGVIYILGVVFLLNDRRWKFMHGIWHICVIAAAVAHFIGIYQFVISSAA